MFTHWFISSAKILLFFHIHKKAMHKKQEYMLHTCVSQKKNVTLHTNKYT